MSRFALLMSVGLGGSCMPLAVPVVPERRDSFSALFDALEAYDPDEEEMPVASVEVDWAALEAEEAILVAEGPEVISMWVQNPTEVEAFFRGGETGPVAPERAVVPRHDACAIDEMDTTERLEEFDLVDPEAADYVDL